MEKAYDDGPSVGSFIKKILQYYIENESKLRDKNQTKTKQCFRQLNPNLAHTHNQNYQRRWWIIVLVGKNYSLIYMKCWWACSIASAVDMLRSTPFFSYYAKDE